MRVAPNAIAGLILAATVAAVALAGCTAPAHTAAPRTHPMAPQHQSVLGQAGATRPGAASPKATRPAAAQMSLKPREHTHLPVGATVPALPMTALDGHADALENYRGLPVLLVFWATWCPTCTNELPHIEDLHLEFASQGLKVLCVNASNEKLEKLRDFVAWKGYTMPVFGQFTGAAARDFLINNIPTLYFVGRDGVIQDVHSDEIDPVDLHARTKKLLESH